MTTAPTAPTTKSFSFYEILPDGRIQFFVDASLLKSLSHCERYFYLKHVKNLRSKSISAAKPFPMAIGSWWSNVMEKFYNALRDQRELANGDIADIAVTAWAEEAIEQAAFADPEKFGQFGDLPGAVLMLQEYYNSQYIIDKQNWKVIAVEEGFGLNKEVLLGQTSRVVVYWIGKPDLVIVEGGRLTPVDHKTVSRIDGYTTNRYKPSSQMPGYTHSCEVIAKSLGYAVRVDRCVVNICSRARPTEKPRTGNKRPRFVRAYPSFNREEIEEWRRGVINKCERLAHCLKTNEWTWSETSCDNFYMRPCDFKKLDSSTPSARDIVMAADFITGKPWQPYQLVKEKEED
jgi:hypothetical protein